MGKSAGSNTSTSTSSYPSWQEPYVQRFVGDAQDLYFRGGPQLAPGSRISPFNQNELASQQQLLGSIPQVQELGNAGFRQAEFNLGPGQDPTTNPYFQSSLSAATRPITDDFLNRVLPSIRTQSLVAGTYGGSRQGIAQGLATEGTARTIGDMTSRMSSDAYQQGQQLAFSTMGLLPQLQQNLTMPSQLTGAVGAQQRQYEDAVRGEDANRFEYNQRLPYTNLAEFGNMIRSPFGARAESTSTVPPPSTESQIIGGIAALPALIQIIRGLFQ